MKVIDRVLEVENTLTGEAIAMSIDQSALAHIMSVLTDLYSDPEQAVVREYSTNAFDAHIEAGVDRPIEVTTPTKLSPFFRVRDYGLGLDVEDIREIYSRYGASTKRDSNDVVGMLGLGCKSALTYTDQFTLSSVKNGHCVQVAISRDESGAGSMTIAAEYDTDEPSGTEVIVPTKQYNEFEEKANDFFRFWDPGTVLINGAEPKRINGLWLEDDLLLTEDTENVSYVVMGNVAYPVERNPNRFATIAFVPIGAVQFTPSREALQYTKLTKDTLEAVALRVTNGKGDAVQKLIDAAPSKREALKVALTATRMYGTMGNNEMVYKGSKMPHEFPAFTEMYQPMEIDGKTPRKREDGTVEPLKERQTGQHYVIVDGEKRHNRKSWEKMSRVPINVVNQDWVFIIGYEGGKDFSPYRREKLNLWQRQQREASSDYRTPDKYMLMPALQHSEYIDPSRIVQWADIDAMKVVREKTGLTTVSGKPQGAYSGYVAGVYEYTLLASDIDPQHGLYYMDLRDSSEARLAIQVRQPKATFVEMSSNRVNKFKRDFPSAKKASEEARKIAERWVKRLKAEDLAVIGLSRESYERQRLAKFDPTLVEDPELKAAILMASNYKTNKTVQAYEAMGRYVSVPTTEWVNPLDKYPLLTDAGKHSRLSDTQKNHFYLYVNAAYAAEKGV